MKIKTMNKRKIIIIRWAGDKPEKREVFITPFISEQKSELLMIPTENIYFVEPLCHSGQDGNCNPEISIRCSDKETGKDFSMEVIFSKRTYKDVFCFNTTKDLITVCLLKK